MNTTQIADIADTQSLEDDLLTPRWIHFDEWKTLEDQTPPEHVQDNERATRDFLIRREQWSQFYWLRNYYRANRPDHREQMFDKFRLLATKAGWLGTIKAGLGAKGHLLSFKFNPTRLLTQALTKPTLKPGEQPTPEWTQARQEWSEIQSFLDGHGGLDNLPNPISGTKFVNPDGTVFKTTGKSPVSARIAYAKRHGIDPDLVSVSRVIRENGESYWVVAPRKPSTITPSSYWSDAPSFRLIPSQDQSEDEQRYLWCGETLHHISRTPPTNAYRLTVRDLEIAILQGAPLGDLTPQRWDTDPIIADVNLDDDISDDIRQCFNEGRITRDAEDLDEAESALYWGLIHCAMDELAQLILEDSHDGGSLATIKTFFDDNPDLLEQILDDIEAQEDEFLIRTFRKRATQFDREKYFMANKHKRSQILDHFAKVLDFDSQLPKLEELLNLRPRHQKGRFAAR